MKRLLLDENLPKRLAGFFSAEFEVASVPDLGWQSKKNGELLSAMDAEGIKYLLTADRNLCFQQNLDKYSVVVIVLKTFDTRLTTLSQSVGAIESGINKAEPSVSTIEIDLRS